MLIINFHGYELLISSDYLCISQREFSSVWEGFHLGVLTMELFGISKRLEGEEKKYYAVV